MNPETTTLRPFPYPYLAMMAICSDLDETPDARVYREIARFLNGSGETAMGPGLGLEVGNTIYFDMPQGQFSYWNADDEGREMVRLLIRSGHIDCLHSFGDLATGRRHAGRALEELDRHGCRMRVWVDHAVAPTNLGGDIMRGEGDVPGAPAYHADLTIAYGIRYVWRGRVTSVTGQDGTRRLGGICRADHPWSSARTLGKELVKGWSGALQSGRYAMHARNDVTRDVTLRDGRPGVEFIRCNPHWDGVGCGATAQGLSEVLDSGFLDRLEARGGVCVLYTHLGKIRDRRVPFGPRTVQALRLLAGRAGAGRILVTTTRRLLDHVQARKSIRYTVARDGDACRIDLGAEGTDGERGAVTDGLTFYVADPDRTRLCVGGREIAGIRRNPPDRTGRRSVSIPWEPLRLPQV